MQRWELTIRRPIGKLIAIIITAGIYIAESLFFALVKKPKSRRDFINRMIGAYALAVCAREDGAFKFLVSMYKMKRNHKRKKVV